MGSYVSAVGRPSPFVLAALIFLILPAASSAQENEEHRFGVSLGLFVTDRNSDTQVDSAGGSNGTDVDLEADLGLDTSNSVFRVDGYFRFSKKHRLDFSVFDLSRSASQPIQRDIEWNDTLFPVDTTVDATFNLAIYKAAYTWGFLQRENGYLGLTAGLYVADISNTLSGPVLGERERAGITAPLPVIGLRGEYHFSDRWTFRASGEVFALEYGDYDGSLYDVYAGLDYQIIDHVAVGVGLNSVKMNIGVTKQDITGNLDWRYDGGLIFFKFDF